MEIELGVLISSVGEVSCLWIKNLKFKPGLYSKTYWCFVKEHNGTELRSCVWILEFEF